jgi:hypothetical protein
MKQRALWSAIPAPDLPFAAGRACAPNPSGDPDDRLVVRHRKPGEAKAAPYVEKHPGTTVGFVARPFDGGIGYGFAKD